MSGTPDTTTPAVTEEMREALWFKVAQVRDAAPRRPDDADSYDVVDAILPIFSAALAAERGKADALRAAMHALAEEWERGSVAPYWVDRLRAIADGQR